MLSKQEVTEIMGANLRRIREERQLTLKELASMLEITPGYLGLIENGKRRQTAYLMFMVGEVLDIRISELFIKSPYAGYTG